MSGNETTAKGLTEERFKTVFLLFKIAGFPIYIEKGSKLRCIYNIGMMMCTYSLYLSSFLDFILSSGDLKYFMKTFRDFIVMVMYMWMEYQIRVRIKEINYLFRLTESFTYEDLPTKDPETGASTVAGIIPRIHYIMKRATIFSLILHLVQSSRRMLTSRSLMFNAWLYFDTSASPTYEIVQVSQIIATFHFMGMLFGPPYLFALLACIACTQLEKISDLLTEIKRDHTSLDRDVNKSGQIQEKLNICIRLHQDTIKFLTSFENTLSTMMCGVFFLLLCGLCGAAFSAVMSLGDHTDVSQAMLTYCILIGFVFCYCRSGTLVSGKFEDVRDAAWASDWVGAPVSYQRCIQFIIAEGNREFTLTAGKFVPISHDTMMNMINQSFSFFMFLLTMKDKSEGNA